MTKARIKRGIVTLAVVLFSLAAGNWLPSDVNARQDDKPAEQVNKNILGFGFPFRVPTLVGCFAEFPF